MEQVRRTEQSVSVFQKGESMEKGRRDSMSQTDRARPGK